MPIHKYLLGGHYHVVVDEFDSKFVSVGLTSNKPNNPRNQKLHKVYESNGKIARLKRNADIKDKKNYSKRKANFNIDIDSEQKAYQIGMNKKNKKK